jgi:hypothetical protein
VPAQAPGGRVGYQQPQEFGGVPALGAGGGQDVGGGSGNVMVVYFLRRSDAAPLGSLDDR